MTQPLSEIQSISPGQLLAGTAAPAGDKAPRNLRLLRAIFPLLVTVGVQFWLILGRGMWGRDFQLRLVLAVCLLCAIPFVVYPLAALLDRLRNPSATKRRALTIAIAVLASIYLYFSAVHTQKREIFPKYADERVYLLQARLMSEGKLWMPRHELGDFFEVFYVLQDPVYAPIYFVGGALPLAPMLLMGLPPWLASLALCGIAIGLCYRIVAEAIDGLAGLLAALLMTASPLTWQLSTMLLAQPLALALGLLSIWGWLRWRHTHSVAWAAVIGVASGWGAVVRPVDAICFAAPIGIAMLGALLRSKAPLREWVRTAVALVLPAIPFFALQVVLNVGVTGHPLESPYTVYLKRDYPGVRFGFYDGRDVEPVSTQPQKRVLYDDWVKPMLREHLPERAMSNLIRSRLPKTADFVIPHPFFLFMIPLGMLAWTNVKFRVVFGVFITFILLYTLYPFFLEHYCFIVIPAIVVVIVAAESQVDAIFPRVRAYTTSLFAAVTVALCLSGIPETNRLALPGGPVLRSSEFGDPQLKAINRLPAVVLFRYDPKSKLDTPHVEPVYNTDTPNPDDAAVIRAQDLGDERNMALYRYYAAKDPVRHVFRFDRTTDKLHYLGTAKALAAGEPPATTTTTSPSP